jgi:protease I
MPKVLLIIGEAAETTDTLYPYFRVQEDGFECVVAAPEQRTYQLVLHDRPEGWDLTRETLAYRFAADVAFREVRPEEYAGLILSGGRAPEYLRYDPDLLAITRHFFGSGKPVACVCHGIEIPAAADVLRGRTVTTVAKCRFDAEFAGATYVDQPAVIDGNLVTARTFWDAAPWMRAFMRLLAEAAGRNRA